VDDATLFTHRELQGLDIWFMHHEYACMTKRTRIKTVSDLVTAFGGNKSMGDWADVGETAVCNWKDANEIPRGYHLRLWFEAERRGLDVDPALFGIGEYFGERPKRSRPAAHA
jgi:hypothetical protein